MSERMRWLMTCAALVAGLALAGCGGESLVGPTGFDGGEELSGLTVVPDGGGELQGPGLPGGVGGGLGDGPALDDEGEPEFQDPDHR